MVEEVEIMEVISIMTAREIKTLVMNELVETISIVAVKEIINLVTVRMTDTTEEMINIGIVNLTGNLVMTKQVDTT